MAESRVRRMHPGEEPAVAAVLGLAFADQPNSLAIARGDPALARRIALEGMAVAKLGRRHKNLWVAELDGQIDGALNAVPWPRCQMSLAEKARTAPGMILAMGAAVPRGMKIMSAWARRDPREPHWHVGPVGVRPDRQRMGLGGALMTSFLELADEDRSPVYLETDRERNLAFYERFGFAIIGREDILGVPNWYMWREASQAPRAE